MNKAIIIFVIILVVVIGGYFLFRGGPEISAPEQAVIEEPEEVIFEEEESGQEEASMAEIREITVIGREFSFSPETITVTAGEKIKIVFQNQGKFPHDFRIEELGIGTRVINPGETAAVEFIASGSGTFTTFCSVGNHRALGMEGSLISQ